MTHAHAIHRVPHHDRVIAAVSSAVTREHAAPHAGGQGHAPFVTISRQAGAGGRTLAQRLADRLNALAGRAEHARPWTVWDDALVERVAAEHGIPAAAQAAFEQARHGWVRDLLTGLPAGEAKSAPDDFKVYRRVALTIRALASVGHVIIVGRGGAFITSDLSGGVHVRVVAPLDYRVQHMADALGVSPAAAAARVRDIEQSRASFHRRYWPGKSLAPENFSATFNAAAVPGEETLAECVLPLVRGHSGATRRPRGMHITQPSHPGIPQVWQGSANCAFQNQMSGRRRTGHGHGSRNAHCRSR